jgi:two-component system sensor kinase FixL
LINQLLVQPSLMQLMVDAPTINIAGRQRMYSQRIAKAALTLDRAADRAERDRRVSELKEVARLWAGAHETLQAGLSSPSLFSRPSRRLLQNFAAIEPSYSILKSSIASLIQSASGLEFDSALARQSLSRILEHENDYLQHMEAFVSLYERETRARVDRLLQTGWAVTGLILVVLLGIGRLILRPAGRMIEQQFRALAESRDELENRVRERTRSLQREVAERAVAEAKNLALLDMFSHAARTHTLGEMASGLAHELNQPLGAIANYTEGCLVMLDAPQPAVAEVRSALEKILATTLRAGQIIKRVRHFVTRRGLERQPFEANRLVEEVVDLLGAEAERRGIGLRMELAPELPCLHGDPAQIQQVLINLIRNAFEALAESKNEPKSVKIQTRKAEPGGVEFLVIDQGEGISADRLDRIFEPYFSTRAEGMGMGLAISRTIVEAHQGKFRVESVLDVETIFRFILPPGDRPE